MPTEAQPASRRTSKKKQNERNETRLKAGGWQIWNYLAMLMKKVLQRKAQTLKTVLSLNRTAVQGGAAAKSTTASKPGDFFDKAPNADHCDKCRSKALRCC